MRACCTGASMSSGSASPDVRCSVASPIRANLSKRKATGDRKVRRGITATQIVTARRGSRAAARIHRRKRRVNIRDGARRQPPEGCACKKIGGPRAQSLDDVAPVRAA